MACRCRRPPISTAPSRWVMRITGSTSRPIIPPAQFWFHPHMHGLAVNQVSSGMAGIISVGEVGDYAYGDMRRAPFPQSDVRHLVLKDMQVLAGGTVQFRQRPGDGAERRGAEPGGRHVLQQFPASPAESAPGFMPGRDNRGDDGNNYVGGTWFFTVSGQQFPTIKMTDPDGEVWRLTNASGSRHLRSAVDQRCHAEADDRAARLGRRRQHRRAAGHHGGNHGATRRRAIQGRGLSAGACPTVFSSVPVCVSELAMMPSVAAKCG